MRIRRELSRIPSAECGLYLECQLNDEAWSTTSERRENNYGDQGHIRRTRVSPTKG